MTHRPRAHLSVALRSGRPALTVDGFPVRPLGLFIDEHEGEIASMLSDARDSGVTSWDLYGNYAEQLPEVLVDRRGRLLPAVRKVIGRFARDAAGRFGPTGFCGEPLVWAAWFMTEHSALQDLLWEAERRRSGARI